MGHTGGKFPDGGGGGGGGGGDGGDGDGEEAASGVLCTVGAKE